MLSGSPSVLLTALALALAQGDGSVHDAARDGDLVELRALLAEQPELLEARDGSDRTPLHQAVRYGRTAMVKLLIERGAELDEWDFSGRAPLHVVRDAEVVELLLAAGADLRLASGSGLSPVQEAIEHGRRDVVDALVEAGAELDFLSALVAGRADLVERMVELDPPLATEDAQGHNYFRSRYRPVLRYPLHVAAHFGHAEVVRVLLEHGAAVNLLVGDYRSDHSALAEAVWGDHAEAARVLLERGAAPFLPRAAHGITLLDFAVERGSPELVDVMLSHGAALTTGRGRRTILRAAWVGRAEALEVLLAHGADPRLEVDCWTPLFLAALAGHEETADLLIEAGAELDVFGAAALGRTSEVERFLAESPGLVSATEELLGWTPLACAVWNDRLETARLLIDRGAAAHRSLPPSVGLRDPRGMYLVWGFPRRSEEEQYEWAPSLASILELAVRRGSSRLASLLLENGACPGARDLHEALRADEDALELTRLILERGGDPNELTGEEDSALHAVVHLDESEAMVHLLLTHGAALEARDSHGWSALDRAVLFGELGAARCLLEHGAEPSFVAACGLGQVDRVRSALEKAPARARDFIDFYGFETPAQFAAARGQREVLDLLVSATGGGAELSSDPLRFAARHGRLEIVEHLLRRDPALVKETADDGRTLLHEAAEADSPELIEMLLEQALELEARDDEGRTALHVAAERGSLRAIDALLRSGAELEAHASHGATPLHLAASCIYLDETQPVIELLIERGAEVDAVDSWGRTPLEVAHSLDEVALIIGWPKHLERARRADEVLREHGAED